MGAGSCCVSCCVDNGGGGEAMLAERVPNCRSFFFFFLIAICSNFGSKTGNCSQGLASRRSLPNEVREDGYSLALRADDTL